RISRAMRAWRQGLALSAAEFNAPLAIAVGERRRNQFLRRAFLLTEKIDGQPVLLNLARFADPQREDLSLTRKRAAIRRLAALVRRFHDSGFVHGDLVATNIFVAGAPAGERTFYFMDNDRTRRYPSWMPQRFWKRNLIQLNRMPLPGISLQDRMRFFHAYLGTRKLSRQERRLARWLELNTRRRRQECDGVDARGDFRRLMRWAGDPARTDLTGGVDRS
ncbi:MAG TPA: lipopolysaccharide kinase InaA family protein, partial [Candidatus Binatia bacterium]|nr:lipopolysaccharide kinase InaA family protein [Candidatus Binatia bacterium]